ncbi:hypothetical protein [Roseobacter litoralis]|uniref:hypothetical protein n=1 Tax=Roseobacter litoralis TaxID=42443 RepID=UPI002495553D|nr:hypothetical protein [Roseobacter litoralis]
MSIFALTTDDAYDVLSVARGHDPQDAYSKHVPPASLHSAPNGLRIGVPSIPTFYTTDDPLVDPITPNSKL